MSGARVIRILFVVIASAMALAALADVVLYGRLTWISPLAFGALVAVLIAFVLHGFFVTFDVAYTFVTLQKPLRPTKAETIPDSGSPLLFSA